MRILVMLPPLLLLAACPTPDGPSDSDDDGIEGPISDYGVAYADYTNRCIRLNSESTSHAFYNLVEDDDWNPAWARDRPSIGEIVEQFAELLDADPTVVFDRSAYIEDCLVPLTEELQKPCAEVDQAQFDAACNATSGGTVALDASCDYGDQCESDHCSAGIGAPTCGTCLPPRGDTGASCDASATCRDHLFCSAGTCVPFAGVDEPCSDRPCDQTQGVYCNEEVAEPVCRRPLIGQVVGDPCTPFYGHCGAFDDNGLYCPFAGGNDSSCAAWTVVGSGEACNAVGTICPNGYTEAYCAVTDQTTGDGECAALPVVGESCANILCNVKLAFCDDSLVCRALGTAGGVCNEDFECDRSLYCVDGACRPDPAPVFVAADLVCADPP